MKITDWKFFAFSVITIADATFKLQYGIEDLLKSYNSKVGYESFDFSDWKITDKKTSITVIKTIKVINPTRKSLGIDAITFEIIIMDSGYRINLYNGSCLLDSKKGSFKNW